MKNILSPKVKWRLCLFLSFLILFYTTACTHFKGNAAGRVRLAQIGDLHKEFIIYNTPRDGDYIQVFLLMEPDVTRTHLSGRLTSRAGEAEPGALYLSGPFTAMGSNFGAESIYHGQPDWPNPNGKESSLIVQEVHIFIEGPELAAGPAAIPMETIHEIRIIEKDNSHSTGRTILIVVGVIALIFILLLIVAAATKSSCPYIYTYDGEGYLFQGEIYGGAIQRNLERHDFMPLPLLKPVDGEYRLRLSNELKERQYTNLAELEALNGQKDLLVARE